MEVKICLNPCLWPSCSSLIIMFTRCKSLLISTVFFSCRQSCLQYVNSYSFLLFSFSCRQCVTMSISAYLYCFDFLKTMCYNADPYLFLLFCFLVENGEQGSARSPVRGRPAVLSGPCPVHRSSQRPWEHHTYR